MTGSNFNWLSGVADIVGRIVDEFNSWIVFGGEQCENRLGFMLENY